MGWPKDAFLNLRQIITPKSRPAPGGNLLYVKADGGLCLLDSDGTERVVNGLAVEATGLADGNYAIQITGGEMSLVALP